MGPFVVEVLYQYCHVVRTGRRYFNKTMNRVQRPWGFKKHDLNLESKKIKLWRFREHSGINRHSDYSNTIQKALLEICDLYFNAAFGRNDIVNSLRIPGATGTSYIKVFAWYPCYWTGEGSEVLSIKWTWRPVCPHDLIEQVECPFISDHAPVLAYQRYPFACETFCDST